MNDQTLTHKHNFKFNAWLIALITFSFASIPICLFIFFRQSILEKPPKFLIDIPYGWLIVIFQIVFYFTGFWAAIHTFPKSGVFSDNRNFKMIISMIFICLSSIVWYFEYQISNFEKPFAFWAICIYTILYIGLHSYYNNHDISPIYRITKGNYRKTLNSIVVFYFLLMIAQLLLIPLLNGIHKGSDFGMSFLIFALMIGVLGREPKISSSRVKLLNPLEKQFRFEIFSLIPIFVLYHSLGTELFPFSIIFYIISTCAIFYCWRFVKTELTLIS
jgi:hypothetical protein